MKMVLSTKSSAAFMNSLFSAMGIVTQFDHMLLLAILALTEFFTEERTGVGSCDACTCNGGNMWLLSRPAQEIVDDTSVDDTGLGQECSKVISK
jgi:hypothetical protein